MNMVFFSLCILTFLAISQVEAQDNEWTPCNPLRECREKRDFPAVDLKEYYKPAEGFEGNELREKLNSIIKDHYVYSYGCVWNALAELDGDPNNPDSVIDFFTSKSIPVLRRDCGKGDGDSWNREHIWAKSQGFPEKRCHAYTDVHHLRAADRSVNGDRSNYDYKEGGTANDECTSCNVDKEKRTFEPSDFRKGETARMMLYMDVRYEGDDNSFTDDLVLTDDFQSGNKDPASGFLSDLLKWHCDFPPSEEERRRNDGVHSWQGNRNPFIDHPEYASSIWEFPCQKYEKPTNESGSDNQVQPIKPESPAESPTLSFIDSLRQFLLNWMKEMRKMMERMFGGSNEF
mmetsp:Transcript_9828/g.29226  ORF Transcript_9828/g.29226 Transcript_9828/m.29226 type:complete len:345 (+) Transcript_9828:212-1246(+)